MPAIRHLRCAKKWKTFLLTMVFCSSANAIDFKIDLPPDKGVAEVAQKEIADIPYSDNELSLNNVAERLEQHPLGLPTNQAEGFFPTPKCILPNVAFWEKIYRDADVTDGVFHDREHLDRVFLTVRLQRNSAIRAQQIASVKKILTEQMTALANNLNHPETWSKMQRQIAGFFHKNELNRSAILQSVANLRVQTGLHSRFEAGVQRSLEYLPIIHRILREQGLPSDLAYLPHVESSYHPYARSKVGAVGLWQIMPDTMRHLLGNAAVNRRTEVVPASTAAAKLLRQNFLTTKSWPLALTAYNHGLGGVMRAVRTTKSTDLCTIIEKYDSPNFKFASSNFYAQFIAARNLAMMRYDTIAKSSDKPFLRSFVARTGRAF